MQALLPFHVQPLERHGELARRLLQKLASDEFCENGDLTKNCLVTGLKRILITCPKIRAPEFDENDEYGGNGDLAIIGQRFNENSSHVSKGAS